MKKTISINLAGLVYQIDDDAYGLLATYLEKLKVSFSDPNEQKEILSDIEHRFAELFSEKLSKSTEVVNKKMVQEAIDTLGEVELIEEESSQANARSEYVRGSRKLFRSTEDKLLAGVLGGLSVYFGIEAIWLRLIFVLLAIASVGVPVGIIYIILWLVMPKAETASQKLQMKGAPVNLSNLQDNIKKNLSSENLSRTGSRVADGFGEMFRLSAKTIALIVGAIISFKLILFSFAWFFATFFVNFLGAEYLGLIFNSHWQFLFASFSLFTLIALPFIVAVYLLFKTVRRQEISWSKTIIGSAAIWVLALLIAIVIGFSLAQNYKVESQEQNYVELPYKDNLQELKVEFVNELENEDFKFVYKKGKFKSGGFEYSNKDLKLNSIFLHVVTSEDSTYSLAVSKTVRAKTKEEANEHLGKFVYNVELVDGEKLRLPLTLTLKDEHKFRMQEMYYTLSVPVGSKISFPKYAHYYIDEISLKDEFKEKQLANNTWLMTSNGLECLTCEIILDEEEDLEFDETLEDFIEQEIEDALEDEFVEMHYQKQLKEDTINEAKNIDRWLDNNKEEIA
ncbi:MAG: phage shock protein PspC (stress-responsive transcriptional regulator) [Chitinophagales bacterium]|jgi:phage shock protein PspC (stress-responsive transcriptional regulator)